MSDTPTCGQGLAANAALPEQVGRLVAATAAVLEAHLGMLDVSDPRAAAEHALYIGLVGEHRRAAQVLGVAARQMARARDLPMGSHIDSPEANAAMRRAFAEFVESEAALHASLAARLEHDRQMLAAM